MQAWLPDAMEAPTPISAYLHAASMVKVGVYIFARAIIDGGNIPHVIGGVGMVMASSFTMAMRIWDGVTDPFIGYMVDKTDRKSVV